MGNMNNMNIKLGSNLLSKASALAIVDSNGWKCGWHYMFHLVSGTDLILVCEFLSQF